MSEAVMGAHAVGRWQNWARTVTATPAGIVDVAREADIVAAVRYAGRHSLRVKALGSGHSYNDIADVGGAIGLAMSSHAGIERVDGATGRVTVRSGTSLAVFCSELASRGLALPVLGAITDQTVAGLVSTATHGTGRHAHSLSDAVVGLRFVDAGANVVDVSLERDPDLLDAARVGLGSLGILSAVTFQCVPGYDLWLETRPVELEDAIADLEVLQHADHFGFWWFPRTRWVVLRTAHRRALDRSRPGRPPVAGRDPWHEAALWCIGHTPAGTSIVNSMQRALRFGRPRIVEGRWDEVFPCPGTMRQVGMEYALPLEATAPALESLRALFQRHAVHAPVDVRFGAADQAWLSPSHGRRTCYIGVAVAQPFGRRIPYERLFRALETVFARFGGRPHWGKMHTLDAARLAALYPRWRQFAEVRNQFDPARLFTNLHLHAVLGP